MKINLRAPYPYTMEDPEVSVPTLPRIGDTVYWHNDRYEVQEVMFIFDKNSKCEKPLVVIDKGMAGSNTCN